jgi:hypothetical protein
VYVGGAQYESAVNVYASLMGARHIMIDRGRQTVPTSGTVVGSDPLAALAFLEPSRPRGEPLELCRFGAAGAVKCPPNINPERGGP